MRKINEQEKAYLVAMANALESDSQRVQLLKDIEDSEVEDASPDCALISFHIHGYERPPYLGQEMFRGRDNFPVEGTVTDSDGQDIHVFLFSDQNDRVLEMEFVKPSGDLIVAPKPDTFRLK